MGYDLKAIAKSLAEEIRQTWSELRDCRGISGFFKAAPAVVKKVEAASKALDLPGVSKKQLAVKIIMELVPRPAWLPDLIVEWILSWAIERAVAAMKKGLG